MTEAQPHNETPTEVNLGILDGDVSHVDINRSISASERVILFGEQTRLPRLHAADPLVLFFWRVLKKVPPYLRDALIDGPISITLVRGDTLFHFRDVRCHQAVHIGRRRRTIYLPEILLLQAEEKGYNHWSIAEGVIFAAWMLLDYLLLADVLSAYGERARDRRTPNGSEVGDGGIHRRLRQCFVPRAECQCLDPSRFWSFGSGHKCTIGKHPRADGSLRGIRRVAESHPKSRSTCGLRHV